MIGIMLSTLVSTSAAGALAGGSEVDGFVEWASKNAVPIKTVEPGSRRDDLRPLKEIVGDARVVCLGESRHDVHEHFRFKHRLIEFLVEEMGFTLFAMEESLPSAGLINEYVLGGDGDPETLLTSMGGWFIWDTNEVLALVKWMRAYNQDATHEKKLRFFGIDITDPRLGLTNVLGYLNEVDAEYAASFTKKPDALALLSADIWSETLENYKRLSERDLDTLTKRFTGLLSRFEDRRVAYVSRSSRARYDWLSRQALVAAKANEMFTVGVKDTFVEAGNIRERAMTDNIRWILKEVGRGERLIVWAHNFHVARAPADLDVPGRPPVRGMISMIAYLNEELGDEMLSVGFSFNRGDYPDGPLPSAGRDTVDGVLARVGFPMFVADLREAPGPWVKQKVSMRGQGGHAHLVPGDAFDAVFFADVVTKTVPTTGARRRFDSLRW